MKMHTSAVFVASLSVAFTLIIVANVLCFTMLAEVNERRPEKEQISGWQLRWRLYEVMRLHAELYPKSLRRKQLWALIVVGGIFLFGGFFATAVLNSH